MGPDDGSRAASGAAENPDVNAPFNRGDLHEPESTSPLLTMEVGFARLCEFSGRLLLRVFDLPTSGSERDAVVVEGKGGGCDKRMLLPAIQTTWRRVVFLYLASLLECIFFQNEVGKFLRKEWPLRVAGGEFCL